MASAMDKRRWRVELHASYKIPLTKAVYITARDDDEARELAYGYVTEVSDGWTASNVLLTPSNVRVVAVEADDD